MPFWAGNWVPPSGWLWWIFPLVGLVFIVVMAFVCRRMMGVMAGSGCMGGHGGKTGAETEDLRREVRELKHEIQKLRDRN